MRIALQALAVVAAGAILGAAANSLSPRPTRLGEAVHSRAATAGLCAAPPAAPAAPPFAPAAAPEPAFAPVAPPGCSPGAEPGNLTRAVPSSPGFPPATSPDAGFVPAGSVPGASDPCPECPRAVLFAGGTESCGTCHARPRAAEVLR